VPEIAEGRIVTLRIMANPDKLGYAARQEECLSHREHLSGLVLLTTDE